MEQEPLIVFLHIPKTAGQTVRVCVLPRQYKAGEMFASMWAGKVRAGGSRAVGVFAGEFESIGIFNRGGGPGVIWFPESLAAAAARFRQLPGEQRARVRLFYCEHLEFGLHERLSRPVSYFTLLREPVARVLSHNDFSAGRHAPDPVNLAEHIAAHVEPNLQTRLLAGPPDQIASLSPAEQLERARRNLCACTIVGLTERFDETMLLLKKAYGWRMPFYERRNVGRRHLSRQDIPAEITRQIEADNSLDVALYAYAQELFAAQVRRYGPTWERDVQVFRALNWLWQRVQKARAWLRATAAAVNQHLIDPAYAALARWGGLRRLVPAPFAPRVVAAVEGNDLYFDLWIGGRRVGNYDPQKQRWDIQRPFHLLVDERTLPGGSEGMNRRKEDE
jgi:hypothetical protein